MISDTEPEELQRLPGLFRLWEIPSIVLRGGHYRIEDTVMTHDGEELFVIYQVIVPGVVH